MNPIRKFYFLNLLLLVGCMITLKPSSTELQALEHPPAEIEAKINKFFPRALAWYSETETELLSQGRELSVEELAIARHLGIQQAERVRVIVLEVFPMPTDPELKIEAEKYGLGSALEGGRTLGYAILLKSQLANNRTILTHELVHIAQRERLGKEGFLRRYLVELEMLGYARSPLELEAYAKQEGLF